MRYSTSSNFLRLLLIHILAVAPLWLTAQENAHLLSVDELFRLGTENSLQLKKQIAALNSADNEAEIKLILLQQYMTLFSYYKQREVLARNIEESEHRLKDIRRMKKEGIVTRNDEIRSELQLTVARTQAIYTYYELQRTCGML